MSDVKLLPCPFCGESRPENGESTFGLSIAKTRVWWIQCCTCGGEGPSRGDIASLKTKKAAIAAWNTRPAPALTPKQEAADTPERMRERCFHDFLRLIQACMAEIDEDDVCVLQTFKGFVEKHGIPGLGTGTCDCEADDCPYKDADVPCDCGLPDCSDPRAAIAKAGQP